MQTCLIVVLICTLNGRSHQGDLSLVSKLGFVGGREIYFFKIPLSVFLKLKMNYTIDA